jgi:hypothetical protein
VEAYRTLGDRRPHIVQAIGPEMAVRYEETFRAEERESGSWKDEEGFTKSVSRKHCGGIRGKICLDVEQLTRASSC